MQNLSYLIQIKYTTRKSSCWVFLFGWFFCLFFVFGGFFCLGFFVPLENLSLIWRRHHYRWKLQNLTFARHLWPLSSEGSLACHTYFDTGHPFIMVIPEGPWHSQLLPSVGSGIVTTCCYDLGLSRLGFEHPTFSLAGRTL